MKKIFYLIALTFSVFSSVAQSSLNSLIKQYESNGFITWNTQSGYYYLINYYAKNNGVLQLQRTASASGNYYRFSFSEINSNNLFYTISKHNVSDGRLVDESDPTPTSINGDFYDLETTCIISCNNPREAYAVYRVEEYSSGVSGLMLNNGYANYNFSTGAGVPFYQAISMVVWNQLPVSHPYKQANREKYLLTQDTYGGPFYDAQNNYVGYGYLVRKDLDKFEHYRSSSTFEAAGPNNNYQQVPGFQPGSEFCDGNIGYAINAFNNYVEQSTIMPISTTQYPFLNYTIVNGQPQYITPNQLTCVNGYVSTNDHEFLDFEDIFTDDFFDCTDDYNANPDTAYGIAMLDCIELALLNTDPNSGVTGVLIENLNSEFPYSISLEYRDGQLTEAASSGTLTKGLYSFLIFYGNGKIYRRYYEIGRGLTQESRTELTIAPNVIVNNNLKFSISSTANESGTIYVHKLDGTLVYSENVNFTVNTPITREIQVSGNIPYNQLRVSIVLTSGKIVRSTALTQ